MALDVTTEADAVVSEPVAAPVTTMDERTKAKMQGYEGEACGDCGNTVSEWMVGCANCGGFNTFEGNLLESNVRVPDQDKASIQIDAQTHLELCSNLVTDNTVEGGPGYFLSVDETGESFTADSLDHFACLVDYSSQ